MRHLAGVICVTLFAATTLQAEDPCPRVPVTYEWIVSACETWNCAASVVIVANGDRHVIPLPTASSDYTWIVLKRIVTDSAVVSPDAPSKLDGYSTLTDASARYATIDTTLQPMLITTSDGKVLVIARSAPETRRRTVGH